VQPQPPQSAATQGADHETLGHPRCRRNAGRPGNPRAGTVRHAASRPGANAGGIDARLTAVRSHGTAREVCPRRPQILHGSIPEEDVPAPARRQSGSQGGDDLVCPDGKPPAEPFAELRVTSVQVVETPCPDHSIETLRRWAESVGVRTPDDSSSELPETPLVN